METVYAEITLKNVFDEEKCAQGLIGEHEVRSVHVNAVVDTGAETVLLGAIALEGMDLMVNPISLFGN